MSDAPFVHDTAIVEEGVEIGARTRVWAHAHLRAGSRLGSDCIIGERVFVDVDVVIGNRCKVQNAALLYHGLIMEDDVFVGPAACVTNDRLPRATTPEGRLRSADDWTVSPVRIRQGASVGACSVIVAGLTVGTHAIVGAGSVVTRDVGDHALVAGNPSRPIGWVCVCGHRINSVLACTVCSRAYVEVASGLRQRHSGQDGPVIS